MIDIEQLKINLHNFLEKIKEIKENEYNEKTKNSVFLDYKELYYIYSNLTEEEVTKNFSINERKAIDCLKLGLENENEFNKLILQFKKNSNESALNVIEFIKSREGFDLINKDDDFSKYSEEELVEIFGGLFGLKLSKDCVKSLKAEKIGRVIGYALSGNFNQDILEYEELKKQNKKLEKSDFLKDKIQSSDKECSYVYNEDGSNLEISCSINEFKNAKITETRTGNKIDHCFINHKEKVITFGQSTGNPDTESQGYSYHKAYFTLRNLVEKEEIDGKTNPYFGYKLRPYLLLGGRFVIDDKTINKEKGRDFKKMLPNSSQKDLEKLNQMQYFRLFGNAVNKEQVNSLSLFNVFIAGCETLNLYEFSEKMALIKSEEEKNKLCFSMVVNHLSEVCDILSNNDLSFATGAKGYLSLFLEDIHSVSNKIFTNFNFKLNDEEYNENILKLNQSISKLIEKLKPVSGEFGNEIINSLRKVNKNFSSLNSYNDEIENVIYAKFENIYWKNNKENTQTIKINLYDLYCVLDVAKHIESKMGNEGKTFFSKYVKALHEKLNYVNNVFYGKKNHGRHYYFSDSSKSNFLKNYGYEVFGEFVKKTSFMFDRRSLVGSSKYTESAIELISFLNDELFTQYPEIKYLEKIDVIKKVKSIR